jgi:hypothetical protein
MTARPHQPIFCNGKTTIQIIGTIAEGQTEFSFDNSAGHYPVDTPVFCSKSDDTSIQYLGWVIASTTTKITVNIPAFESKGTSAKLWKPTAYALFRRGPGIGQSISVNLGVDVRTTRGGQVFKTQTADAVERLSLSWSGRRHGEREAARQYIQSSRSNGLKTFTVAYYDYDRKEHRVIKASFAGGDLAYQPDSIWSGSFSTELIIEGEGYQIA